MLFQVAENKHVLDSFLANSGKAGLSEPSQIRFEALRKIVTSMSKHPEDWDEKCSFNVEYIGGAFISELAQLPSNEAIDNAFTSAFRFLCEYELMLPRDRELNFDFRRILSTENIGEDLDGNLSLQMHYARYQMPVSILKKYLGDERIKSFVDFSRAVESADKAKSEIKKEVEAGNESIKSMKLMLSEQKTAFNFVGLSQGFQKLLSDKNSEKRSLFWSLMGMGSLILAPLLFQLNSISNAEVMGMKQLIPLVPILSIEVILIYFFRIILSNYKSVKTQIMQLELRQTLCQFIQSYADYSSEIKSKDESALEKFENLIFSGIMSDQDKLPTTFDGLDQVGSLVKSLRGS